MKRIISLLAAFVFLFALAGCSQEQDSLKFIRQNATPPRSIPTDYMEMSPDGTQTAEFELNIGNRADKGTIIAEFWREGVCQESPSVSIDGETKELHLSFLLNSHEKEEEGLWSVEVDINTNKNSAITSFAPLLVVGYSFSSYDRDEVIEVNPGTEVVLAAMAFDTGEGVRTLDCERLAAEPDIVSEHSCLLLIRASFAA